MLRCARGSSSLIGQYVCRYCRNCVLESTEPYYSYPVLVVPWRHGQAIITMGFQWLVISTCLCVEMTFTVLLLLPGISPDVWSFFLTSFPFQWLVGNIQMMFWSAVFTIGVVFGDAVMKYKKCRGLLPKKITNAQQEVIMSTRAEMFRAQRNLYISGFVLLLAFVNKRLVVLLINKAHMTQHEDRYHHRYLN